jgi:hypothetical protein
VRLLLETHIDPGVGVELAKLTPEIEVELQQRWRGGALRTASDDEILTAARDDGYVFVTYDVSTIPPLLAQRYAREVASPGGILISARSFGQKDIAGIARALSVLWQGRGQEDWTGHVVFLEAGSAGSSRIRETVGAAHYKVTGAEARQKLVEYLKGLSADADELRREAWGF